MPGLDVKSITEITKKRLPKRDESSNLFDHMKNEHGGYREKEFGFQVVRNFQSDVLARQVEQGMRIENCSGITMNSQNKWQAPAVVKVGAYRMGRYKQ